jgi:uncharacterized protein YbjQ (UPF0145 family)
MLKLLAIDHTPEGTEIGELLIAGSVCSVNVVKDMRENIRNLTGGVMYHYEVLLKNALDRAQASLSEQAQEKGYDGVIGLKISHPSITEGSVEVVMYGNGFRYLTSSC